jgi:hypothetical protein
VWDRLTELDDVERAMLVQSVTAVITSHINENQRLPPGAPPSVMQKEVAESLKAAGASTDANKSEFAQRLEHTSDPAVVIEMLEYVSQLPTISDEVAAAYEERRQMLAVDFGIVSGPLLFLLLMKLKRIKVSHSEVDVEFYEPKQSVLLTLAKQLGLSS